jgi:tetratricopeptide (TPR) repeat protein
MKIQEAIWTQYAELGKSALKSKQLGIAEKMFAAAVEEAQRGTADPLRLAESWFGLAQTHHTQQQGVLAIYFYKKAMAIYEGSGEKVAPQLAATWDNLAAIYLSQGDLAKAHSYFRKSINLYEKLFGKDSEILAPRLLRMGFIYSQLKEFDKAMACYSRSKALTKGGQAAQADPAARAIATLNGSRPVQGVHACSAQAAAAPHSSHAAPAPQGSSVAQIAQPQAIASTGAAMR